MAEATNLTPYDITAGESWACKYKVTRMLDAEGNPVKNLQIGQSAAGPGEVEGVALIKTRDCEKELLELEDIETHDVFVVPFADVWDIDRAVVQED